MIQTLLPFENLAALETGVRRAFGVDTLMPQQMHSSLEFMAAGFTGVRLSTRMYFLDVLLKFAFVFEATAAVIASEGWQSLMNSLMS